MELIKKFCAKLFKLLCSLRIMAKHKYPRARGKISLSRYFHKFSAGEKVAVARELSVPFYYSKRLQGRTGSIIKARGAAYEVLISDLEKPKIYLIKPIHLIKIKN